MVKVDNVTDAGDRTRYYMYWGTGESTKKNLAVLNSNVSVGQISSFNGGTSTNDSTQAILDPRMMSADNFTLAAPGSTRTITSDVTHLLVYAGNEAGDASSGKALAITNRGLNTGATGTDNVTSTFLLPGSTATNFDISQVKLSDNASHQLAVSDTKSTDTTTIASTETGSGASQTTLATRDVTQHSGTNYILTATDNGTLYTLSSGTPSSTATEVFNQAAVNNHLELHSDGTNMIALADNSSNLTANINVYNLTTPASPARVGSQLSVSGGGIGRFCGSVANSSVIIAHDNSTDNTSNIFLSSTPIDNTTGWEYTSTITASLDNTSTVGDANQQYCSMVGFDVGNSAHFYLAIDNNTDATTPNVAVYRIVDNGSAIASSTLIGNLTYTADSLSIDVTSTNVPVLLLTMPVEIHTYLNMIILPLGLSYLVPV